MRKKIAALWALSVIAWGAHRAYDVAPYWASTGWTPAAPYNYVEQTFRCVFDTITEASAFIGQPCASGYYDFMMLVADGPVLYWGRNATQLVDGWEYVHADLQQQPGVPMPPKGSELVLRITAEGQNDSVNWYASPNDEFTYGRMSVPGRQVPETYDLAGRIEGVVWNTPEMISTWDQVPMHIHDLPWLQQVHGRSDWAQETLAIANGARRMSETGVRGTRLIDSWWYVQRDTNQPTVFVWDTLDIAWRHLAEHGVRPHLVIQDSPWPLGNPPVNWSYRALPTGLYEAVVLPDTWIGGEFIREHVNVRNHLAWYLYHYAKRYGPVGFSKNGELTGEFWVDPVNTAVQYVPFKFAECCNEPAYYPYLPWWWSGTLRDPVVDSIRGEAGAGRLKTFIKVYARYCAVVDSALKYASDSLFAEIYCPYWGDGNNPQYPCLTPEEWLPYIAGEAGGRTCKFVSLHSHSGGDNEETYASVRIDSIYHTLERYGMGDKLLMLGEAGFATPQGGNPIEEDTKRAKKHIETLITLWARNSSPEKPVVYYDWQSFSAWWVKDGQGLENRPISTPTVGASPTGR